MKIKQRIAAFVAATVMAVSMMSIGAGAYESRDNWDVKRGTGLPTSVGVPTCTCNIITYGDGYMTYCNSISGFNDRYVKVTLGNSVSYNITTTGLSSVHKVSTSTENGYIFVKIEAKGDNCFANGTVGYNM